MADRDPLRMTPSWHAATRRTRRRSSWDRRARPRPTPSSRTAPRVRTGAARARHRGRDRIAVLMENNRPFLEVTWAAQRSELHYTAINSHLRPAEVQYVLDDCGARALVTLRRDGRRRRGARSLADPGADLRRGRAARLRALRRRARRDGAGPLDDEREGREMLYSSGTTGRPKGVRKALPGTPFGDPSAAPVQIAQGIAMFGGGPGSVYLSPAPLYHAAPLVYSMSMHRLGATVVVMERFDPRAVPRADRALPRHPRAVRADDVRPHAAAPEGGARALRRVEPADGRARRRALPDPRQAPDARVVGPDHPRVLLGHRGHRRHVHHAPGVARPSRLGRPADGRVPHRRRGRRGAAARPGRRRLLRAAGGRSSTTTIPRRRRRSRTRRAGGRSATSATSTTTATSTSPTARPT